MNETSSIEVVRKRQQCAGADDRGVPAARGREKVDAMTETYETHAKGLRILPGQWRPHYAFEQIVWISPPWPSQDYVWLDFPEAIFTNQGLIFLSHVNPRIPSLYPALPPVAWRGEDGALAFDRALPNGARFGGRVSRENETTVALELYLENGTERPLTDVQLQTCLFLRACREFADYSMDNKFVHVPGKGWQSFPDALEEAEERGAFPLGWRGGRRLADWPVMVTVSNQAPRLVAMTWHDATLSLIGNPAHPCMHADPKFSDLDAGQKAEIRGHLYFFEGTLGEFEKAFAFIDR